MNSSSRFLKPTCCISCCVNIKLEGFLEKKKNTKKEVWCDFHYLVFFPNWLYIWLPSAWATCCWAEGRREATCEILNKKATSCFWMEVWPLSNRGDEVLHIKRAPQFPRPRTFSSPFSPWWQQVLGSGQTCDKLRTCHLVLLPSSNHRSRAPDKISARLCCFFFIDCWHVLLLHDAGLSEWLC